jgi:hypothetical protein
MKILNIYFILIIFLCFSCKNKHRTNNSETNSNNLKKIETYTYSDSVEKSNVLFLNTLNYKQSTDSLISHLIGKDIKTTLMIDTLLRNDLIFIELKNTPLKNVVNEAIIVYKYNFLLNNDLIKYSHSLSILDFCSTNKADSIFSIFKKIAFEKNGVPGLTYSNDYLVRLENKIFWIHTNCIFSYNNHMKMIKLFESLINTGKSEKINCECGKVICNN